MSNIQQKTIMFSILVNKYLRDKQAEDFKRGPDTPPQQGRKSRSVAKNCKSLPRVFEKNSSQATRVQRNPAKANNVIKRENISF